MPLHVRVDINSRNLGQVHIGRLETLEDREQVSNYVAWVGEYSDKWTDDNSAEYTHKYDESALVCVRKGFEALEAKGIDFP